MRLWIFLAALLSVQSDAKAFAQMSPSLAGTWRADYRAPGDVLIPIYLDLHETQGQLSGRVRMTWGYESIHSTELHGSAFTLHFGSDLLPLRIEAVRAEDGSLTLDIYDPRTAPVHVKAVRGAVPGAPPRLPLPALRKLPPTAVLDRPPMGWNSWNRFNDKIDDQAVRETADAMVRTGLRDAGYRYVLIDDSWAGERDRNGQLRGNSKFPDMAALASYVHGKGLLLGIYSSPGPTTCGGYPGSYGHEQQDADTFARWGIDYLKYDWCSASDIYKESEMRAVFQKMGDALHRTGRPIVYSLCQYGLANVTAWGPLVGASLWRTVPDIQPSWASIQLNFEQNAGTLNTVRRNAWSDPDILEVGNSTLTAEENRAHFALWAIVSAPLILGNDLRTMPEQLTNLLTDRDLIQLDQQDQASFRIDRTPDRLTVYRRISSDNMVMAQVGLNGKRLVEIGRAEGTSNEHCAKLSATKSAVVLQCRTISRSSAPTNDR